MRGEQVAGGQRRRLSGLHRSEPRSPNMPGRCKFQDAWLAKDIYKDWLVKDPHDIQLARCKACCKAIKLQTMGEAALTSHAVGNGHKAAVRKLVEGKQSKNPLSPDYVPTVFGNITTWRGDNEKPAAPEPKRMLSNNETQDAASATAPGQENSATPCSIVVMNVADHVNGYSSIKDEEEQVALILHLNSSDPSAALDHGVVGTSSTAHNASFQEVGFPTSYIDSCGIPTLSSVGCGGSRVPAHNNNNNNHHHPHLLLQQQPPHQQQQQQHHNTSPSPAHRRRHEEPGRDVAPPPHTPPRRPRPAAAAAAAALAKRNREQRERAAVLQAQAETELEMDERLEMFGEQQAGRKEQMESLEWERRMGVLAWEQEVLREKGRAARQKARAYRMKRRYYGAKLRRMGQDVPPLPSSSSSSGGSGDEGLWGRSERLAKEEADV